MKDGDIVVTRDGQQHRVIYQSGDKLEVRSLADSKRRTIKVAAVTDHKPKAK